MLGINYHSWEMLAIAQAHGCYYDEYCVDEKVTQRGQVFWFFFLGQVIGLANDSQ